MDGFTSNRSEPFLFYGSFNYRGSMIGLSSVSFILME